ncbi:MAG: [acyl-carrier-protein] S-malonyltransferase [Spirochaetales bacterium]|nr:MAG: [acyl-carrier-protein] S-malonyltransferase [Spirochaetales bacterium]
MVVFLFPGQGSQFSGMARDLYEKYSTVRDLFSLASDACERDMKALLFEGSEEELKDTANAQPAIVLASLAAREALRVEGVESEGAAGHSLGEYSAMVDAGVLSAADAFKAVSARGRFMADAGAGITAEKGEIGMAAVVGISPAVVQDALKGLPYVWSANENSPVQVAIGGTKAGMDGAAEALKAAGARRIIPLKVSCPFHTPLMAGPGEAMKDFLAGLNFNDPVKKVWSNVKAAPVETGGEARSLLVEQVTHPVRWVELEASVAALNPSALYEVGPGAVLSGLWAKSGQGGSCMRAGTLEDIDKIKTQENG